MHDSRTVQKVALVLPDKRILLVLRNRASAGKRDRAGASHRDRMGMQQRLQRSSLLRYIPGGAAWIETRGLCLS